MSWLIALLMSAAVLGVAMTCVAYLTWIELAVIHAVCAWCVASAIIITAITALAVFGYLRGDARAAPESPSEPERTGGRAATTAKSTRSRA